MLTEILSHRKEEVVNSEEKVGAKSQPVELLSFVVIIEGVVSQWYNPLTLQPEQSGRVDSIPGRTPPLKRHDKRSRTRLGLLYFCDPSARR